MAIKKTELYSSLWASCDELRGGMDASQYKDFVLTLLFMKYVSDKYKGDPYGMIVVPEGASFDDMLALKGDKEIGDKVNKIISALAEENDLKGVIDLADFNDEDKLGKGKDMVDRLTKLIGTFEGLDMSANRADGDPGAPGIGLGAVYLRGQGSDRTIPGDHQRVEAGLAGMRTPPGGTPAPRNTFEKRI